MTPSTGEPKDFLLVEEDPMTTDAAPPPSAPTGRRAALAALALAAVAAVATIAALRVSGPRASTTQAVAPSELALYGEPACPSCPGQHCDCAWANANTCSAKSYSSDCCWNCCCAAQGGLNQFGRGVIVSPSQTTGAMDRGCSLQFGQTVHVGGNSGATYAGAVTGYNGAGLYQVSISGQSYEVNSERIAECHPLYGVLTWWLPALLVGTLLCLVAYYVYQKMQKARAPVKPERPRSCCG